MTAATAPRTARSAPLEFADGAPVRGRWPWPLWLLVIAAVIGASWWFVAATDMRPSYDPFGWLVWGHQTWHGKLSTAGAPSWKPLTYVFTVWYALFDHVAVRLWTITSVAGTLAGGVFAFRIAYRLTGPADGWRRIAALLAGAFAGLGVLTIQTLDHLVLIANSDQLTVTLLLAAVDAHLGRRPRLAYLALVFASLGRPEAWPFLVLYGAWGFLRVPGMRVIAVLGILLMPAAWFIVPGLTSKSPFISGDLALGQRTVIHGSKVLGVLRRWRSLYELPMQLAALAGLLLGLVRRDREVIGLTAAALLWVVIEIAFALHGWSAVPRYLIEPAAVMICVAGGAVGQLLAGLPDLADMAPTRAARWTLGLLGPAAVVVLLVSLVPAARNRRDAWRTGIPKARVDGRVIDRLADVVTLAGGAKAVLACGQPVALNSHQSQLAWAVGLNVGDVGYNPHKQLLAHHRIVLFTQHGSGWEVQPYNQRPAEARRCARLRVSNATAARS